MVKKPHEIPFQYEDALVSSCASSRLARSLSLRESDVRRGFPVADDESIGPLDVSEEELSTLQQNSPLRQHIPKIDGNSNHCRTLFEQHGAHYERPPLTKMEEQFWNSWDGTQLSHHDHITNNEGGTSTMMNQPTPRIEAFLRSVIFVHQHNNKMGKHEVALNRFSDMLSHELPLIPQQQSPSEYSSFIAGSSSAGFESTEGTTTAAGNVFSMRGMDSRKYEDPLFVPLEDDETIKKFGEKIRRMQQERYRLDENENDINTDPLSASELYNDIPPYTNNKLRIMKDSWWWIGGGHDHGGDQHVQNEGENPDNVAGADPLSKHSSSSHRKKQEDKSKDNSFLLDEKNELGGLEEKDEDETDDWSRHLNWATDDNPDGVPLVHPAMDQGLCGSCWAVSATGTLEASIARNMAYIAYEEAFSSVSSSASSSSSSSSHRKNSDDNLSTSDAIKFAVLAAQEIERQSINTADLSVQELVDCDTRYDQGCAGGNPLLAFYFLHRFGITSSKNYPYTGVASSCKYHKVDQPIATVGSWGILTPDHENNMEKVLRYIGPVAVGLIGADPAFLAYEKGVFTSSKGGKCDFGQADHAMLITGYGEDKSEDGTVTKYWIARNSWGAGWGENGYVKMARLGGKKGHRGVCGIARSPSVALGGMFTHDVRLDKSGLYGSTLSGKTGPSSSRISDNSTVARGTSQIHNIMHRIRTRLGFVQKGIMMSTISGNEDIDAGFIIPFALAIGLLATSLLLMKLYQKQNRRCRHPNIDRQQSEEESVATNCAVQNGIHEHMSCSRGSDGSFKGNAGEKVYLLENSTGRLYTT